MICSNQKSTKHNICEVRRQPNASSFGYCELMFVMTFVC